MGQQKIKMESINICSLNIRGLKLKRPKYVTTQRCLIDVVQRNDVICIQETKCKDVKRLDYLLDNVNIGYMFTPALGHGRGGLLMIWNKLKITNVVELLNTHNLQMARLNGTLIANVYIPDATFRTAYDELKLQIQRNIQDNNGTLLVGDFNTLTDIQNDRTGTASADVIYRETQRKRKLMEVRDEFDLKDAAEVLHNTVHTRTEQNMSSRIDLCLFDKITPESIKITPNNVSDHHTVELKYTSAENSAPHVAERGPGIFKLNNNVLTDRIYANEIRMRLNYANLTETNYINDYEVLKYDIRDRLKEMCNEKHAQKMQEKKYIEKQIEICHEQLNRGIDVNEQLEMHKIELRNWEIKDAKLYVTALKDEYIEVGEGNAESIKKYAKRYAQQTCMTKIRVNSNDANSLTHDMDEIICKATNFYENLYTCTPPEEEKQENLLQNYAKTIDTDDQEILSNNITLDEVNRAITKLKK